MYAKAQQLKLVTLLFRMSDHRSCTEISTFLVEQSRTVLNYLFATGYTYLIIT